MHRTAIRQGLGGLIVFAAMLLIAAPAQASDVATDGSQLEITGDPDSDQITVSSDGTTLTVVDTGTGGATDVGTNCIQVNAQTVACAVNALGEPTVNTFEVQLDNGADSFTNQNFVTEDGHVHSFDNLANESASGVKTLSGGPGSQLLEGGQESDAITGGDGDDRLNDGGDGEGATAPTGGNDVLDGGPGDDVVEYFRAGTAPLTLTLDNAANDGQAGETDNLLNIENVSGSSGNDTLIGNAGANELRGGAGNDTVAGQGGNDLVFGDGNQQVLARGIFEGGPANDTVIGGTGRDGLDCGAGDDVGIRDAKDDVDLNCERVGADVDGDSAALTGKKKNKFKVGVSCSESEGAACAGKLEVTSNGKLIGKGKFSVAAGADKHAKAKLTKKGAKTVKKAGGSLLVTVTALTDEPGGVSEAEGRVLVFR